MILGTSEDQTRTELAGPQVAAAAPRPLHVFLMTDVVGSTALWEADPRAMGPKTIELDGLVGDEVVSRGGRVIKSRGEGDSHFCLFGSVQDAIEAAIAIQLRLADAKDLEAIQLRTALHAGSADDRADDFYGPVVNRCARIREAANPGQILVSEVVQFLAQPEYGFGFKSLGSHRLRDLLRPERLFQVLHSSLPAEFPPPRSLSSRPQNLPIQLTSFIGRTTEIKSITGHLLADRLVTITGPGGTGKTRLALQAASELVDVFEAGVWFVDLAQTIRADTVLPILCSVITPGTEASLETLVAAIGTQRLMLVIDNCEHLHQECRALARTLLLACPNLQILATSRKDLGVPGERVFRLGGMSLPSHGQVGNVHDHDAIHLFVERAVWRGTEIAPEESVQGIAELCRSLDGLPLAIEIAAGATDVLSISDITGSIGQFLERDIPESLAQPRQATMVATIEWSVRLLSAPARDLLQRLMIFPTTWTLAGAEEVCGFGAVPRRSMTDLMRELVSHSLVFTDRSAPDQVRFGVLQTTRQVLCRNYRLSRPLKTRFVSFCEHLAIEAGSTADSVGEPYGAFNVEYETLVRALEIAYDLLPSACSRIAQAMRAFWMRSTHLREGKLWFERLSVSPRLPLADRLSAISGLSAMCINSGDYERAERVLVPAEKELRSGGSYEWARVVGNLAVIWSHTGKLVDSIAGFEACVDFFHANERWGDEALALLNLGVVKMRLGLPPEEYLPLFREALARAEEHELPSMQAQANSCLAEGLNVIGDYGQAVRHSCRALEEWQKGPYVKATTDGFVNLAEVCFRLKLVGTAAFIWHAAGRLEEISGAPLTDRQRKIMDDLRAQFKDEVSPKEWQAANRMVRGKSAPELITMALQALREDAPEDPASDVQNDG